MIEVLLEYNYIGKNYFFVLLSAMLCATTTTILGPSFLLFFFYYRKRCSYLSSEEVAFAGTNDIDAGRSILPAKFLYLLG